jgi:hypothetical protein
MGCANVPGTPTSPIESNGPTSGRKASSGEKGPSGQRRELDSVSDATVRAALERVGRFTAQQRATLDRALNEVAMERAKGPRSIEVSDPGFKSGTIVTSSRGNPVISLHTLLRHEDRQFEAHPARDRPWSEVKGGSVVFRGETRHGHRNAEVIVATKNGRTELYLSIPKSDAAARSLFGKATRREGPWRG